MSNLNGEVPPETAGHELPPKSASASASAAEPASTAAERLQALALATSPLPATPKAGTSRTTTPNQTDPDTTPLSSTRASKSKDVVGDGSFEELMKERAKLRKEKDEHTLAELRVRLAGMDRALSTEIKRRIDLNRSLETTCTSHIADMEARLNDIIDERSEVIEGRLSLLETKVSELNHRLKEETDRIPKDIERRGKELGDMLSSLQEEMNVERRDRLNREGRIVKQVEDHRKYVSGLMEKERKEREETCGAIREEVGNIGKAKAREGETFEQMVEREMEELRFAMGREVRERTVEDDEIVAALNRYTEHLQSSLAAISGVEEDSNGGQLTTM